VSESAWSATIAALVTGGVGAAVGGVGTAIVQSMSHKGESRAAAADLVTNAAGNLADRLDKMNTRLVQENAQMRKALVALTEAVEELLPAVGDDQTRRRVQKAITAARLAFRS
jgi:saccharopine dehydrogenase-like NADP-dependent oxidoreductase